MAEKPSTSIGPVRAALVGQFGHIAAGPWSLRLASSIPPRGNAERPSPVGLGEGRVGWWRVRCSPRPVGAQQHAAQRDSAGRCAGSPARADKAVTWALPGRIGVSYRHALQVTRHPTLPRLHSAHVAEATDVILARQQNHANNGNRCYPKDVLHCRTPLLHFGRMDPAEIFGCRLP
jgi:hypothetical protein